METISRYIADFILFIGGKAQTFWLNLALLDFSWPQIFFDILLVSIIFYFIFSLLKGSRAINVIVGLTIVTMIYFISRTFQLVALNWLMEKFFTIALIAIPIIFQKELRMGLEKLGHTKLFTGMSEEKIDHLIASVVSACKEMAEGKIGALIVIQNQIPLKEYKETGIALSADVSRELILSIFNGKSPLHDGAIIITGDKIDAASCLLPNTTETVDTDLGTRHKAALGIADSTDALAIIVSEEKGTISFAKNGRLEKNISSERLHQILNQLLLPKKRK